MGIKPSMTFLLIKGLKACYLESSSHTENYIHIRLIRPVFLAEFETAEMSMQRFYLEDGQAAALFCWYVLP